MRFVLFVVGIVSGLIAPPWLTAICIVLLAIRYRAWETIVLGLLIDLTWQPAIAEGGILHILPIFTLSCIFVVWAFEPLRSQFLQ